MLKLELAGAERFVDSYQSDRQEFFWDSWTLVKFKETPAGATHKRGMYRNGRWGIAERIEPDAQGRFRFRA